MTLRVIDMPGDDDLRRHVARLCVEQWRGDFPHDTDRWYLDLYEAADSGDGLPLVLVAMDDAEFLGTASLITDDELPGADEPGPWLAAVYVVESHRGQGVGSSLVRAMTARAVALGCTPVYLYTESGRDWYETLGWKVVRTSALAGHDVTVMRWG